VSEIIKKRRKILEIRNDMIEINKRMPTEEELDTLVDILNEVSIDTEQNESGEIKIAKKDHTNDIEQNWI
jgi:hypothetical protein